MFIEQIIQTNNRRYLFMNEQFITEVLQRAMEYLNQEQCKCLNTDLRISLQKYKELEECCTDIMDIEKSYLQYLQLFLIRKKTEGKSDRTLEQYQLHLSKLLQKLNKPLDKITEDDLFLYLAWYRKTRKVSNTYLDNMRLVFSSFFTWCNNKGYISKNPTVGLEPIKSEKKIKKPFSDEELERLRRVCTQERDIALIEFLYSTGVRASELVSLNRNDIDFTGKTVVVFGKGSKEREVYLTATAALHLKDYLNNRGDDNEALFVCTRKPNKRLTVSGLERIVKKLGETAGVDHCHPHRFRRTMATNVLRKGAPLEEVKELLGHTKLDTTMIYCSISRDNVKYTHQRLMSA